MDNRIKDIHSDTNTESEKSSTTNAPTQLSLGSYLKMYLFEIISVFLLFVLAIWLLVNKTFVFKQIANFFAWLKLHPHSAPIFILFFYPLGLPLFLPVNYTTIGFGYVLSVGYNSSLVGFAVGIFCIGTGVILGGIANFFIARYLLKDCVTDMLLRKFRHLHALDSAITAEPIKMVFLLRLVTLPYSMVSYILGVTHVTFIDFFIGSMGIMRSTRRRQSILSNRSNLAR